VTVTLTISHHCNPNPVMYRLPTDKIIDLNGTKTKTFTVELAGGNDGSGFGVYGVSDKPVRRVTSP
jgi:hypothetical protein